MCIVESLLWCVLSMFIVELPIGLMFSARKYGTIVSAMNPLSSVTEMVRVWFPRGETSLLTSIGYEPGQ